MLNKILFEKGPFYVVDTGNKELRYSIYMRHPHVTNIDTPNILNSLMFIANFEFREVAIALVKSLIIDNGNIYDLWITTNGLTELRDSGALSSYEESCDLIQYNKKFKADDDVKVYWGNIGLEDSIRLEITLKDTTNTINIFKRSGTYSFTRKNRTPEYKERIINDFCDKLINNFEINSVINLYSNNELCKFWDAATLNVNNYYTFTSEDINNIKTVLHDILNIHFN